jgi:HrpA-like RNA helicase
MYPGGSAYNGRNRGGRGGGSRSAATPADNNQPQPQNPSHIQHQDPSILSVGASHAGAAAAPNRPSPNVPGNVLGALSALAQANPHVVVGRQQPPHQSAHIVTLADPPRREPLNGAPYGAPQQQPQQYPQRPLQQQQQHSQGGYNNQSFRGGGGGSSGSYHNAAAQGNQYNGGGGRGGGGRGAGVQHVVAGPAPHHSSSNNFSNGPPAQRQKLQEGGMLNTNAKKDYDAIVRAFIENPTMFEIEFPSTLTPTERHHVHKLAMHFNVDHKSHGVGADRVLRLTKKGGGVAAASGGTALSPADHRRRLFTSPNVPPSAAKALPATRVKSVDMYQGAQFLKDSWFESHSKELLANSIATLHKQMVGEIRAQLQSHSPTRNFRPVQPGLSQPPQRPAKAQADMESLQAFRARLPTTLQKDNIIDAVRNNRVTVISGDTGCGKTTQIPQLLYDSNVFGGNRRSDDVVLCTQPRRISALSVAARVAAERGQACGDEVGYIIRFENMTSHATRVVYLTTGILLRRLHSDPDLRGVSCVVVDEVHERDVDTDFALLLLREILIRDPKRNLKIIVMSATIQVERLVDYFLAANGGRKPPLIAIPGTLFRVDEYWLDDALQWLKLPASAAPAMLLQQQQDAQRASNAANPSAAGGVQSDYEKLKKTALTEFDKELEAVVPYDVIVKLVEMFDEQQRNDTRGGVLVFLPGWGPIDRVANMLRRLNKKLSVFMLHSSISAAEQARVFYPPPKGFRKVVLATNVAETSITIDDIVFVIDSGLSKGTTYDVAGNTSSLASQLIAKANGTQRRGRAGRCREGLCVHLLPRATYQRLPDFLPPEILRTSLDEICLQIKAIKPNERCVDVLSQALDAPPRESIEHAVKFLKDVGALDPREVPTNLGRALATLPVHPTLGKMLLLASCFGVLEPIAIIAASLSSKSPFVKPFPHQIEELNAIRHEYDRDDLSDHLVVLRVFQEWERQGCQVDFAMRHLCDNSSLRSIQRTTGQLSRLVLQSGFMKKVAKPEQQWYASRHKTNTGLVRLVLLWSLMPRVATMERHVTRMKGEVFCWDNKPCQVHASSVVFKKKQEDFQEREFIVYYERMRIESQLQIFDATCVSRIAFLLCANHVEVQAASSLNVTHALEDAECKFGPFDGVGAFPSVADVFGPNDSVADDNGAQQRPTKNIADYSAALVDNGIKCFLMTRHEATTLNALRECMDFYFSVSMKHVDAAGFPQELVNAIGTAIGFPVRLEPKPTSAASSGVERQSTESELRAQSLKPTATWMNAAYSDDDVEDKLLGGDDDDEGPSLELVDEQAEVLDVSDEGRRHMLYDAFGDLAIIRRAMRMMEDAREGVRLDTAAHAVDLSPSTAVQILKPTTTAEAAHDVATAAQDQVAARVDDDDDEDDVVVLQPIQE